jgi:hypothetical protein
MPDPKERSTATEGVELGGLAGSSERREREWETERERDREGKKM